MCNMSVHEKNITLRTTTKNQANTQQMTFHGKWDMRREGSTSWLIFAKSLGFQLGIIVGTVVGRQASSHIQQIEFRWNSAMQYENLPTIVMTYYYCVSYRRTGGIHLSISYGDCLTAILRIIIAKVHIPRRYHSIKQITHTLHQAAMYSKNIG